MALGHLLWVAWLCLLLDSSFIKASQSDLYRKPDPNRNLLDVDDFEDLSFDEGVGEQLTKKPSPIINKDYKKSPGAKPLDLFSVDQTLVHKPHVLERIINGASRQWESNAYDPITFPLSSGSQMFGQTQPKPVVYESQSTPSAFYEGSKPIPPSLGKMTGLHMVEPKPVLATNVAALPPRFEAWQPVPPSSEGMGEFVPGSLHQQQNPDSSQSGVDSTNVASSGFVGTQDNDPLSYGSNMVELPAGNFPTKMQPYQKYSPVNPKPQSESWTTPEWFGQGNGIDNEINLALPFLAPSFGMPSYASWYGLPYAHAWLPSSYPSQKGYLPDNSLSKRHYVLPGVRSLPQKAPVPPRKSFVVQSKNGYQRQRFLKSKTTYMPDYKVPKGKYGKSVKVSRGAVQNPPLHSD